MYGMCHYLKAYKSDGHRPPPILPEMIDGEFEFKVDLLSS